MSRSASGPAIRSKVSFCVATARTSMRVRRSPEKSPNSGDEVFLPAFDSNGTRRADLVVRTPQRLLGRIGLVDVTPDREDPLAGIDARRGPDGFAEGLSHPIGNPVGPRARRLFVLPEHVMGELPEDHLVVSFTETFEEVAVRRQPR